MSDDLSDAIRNTNERSIARELIASCEEHLYRSGLLQRAEAFQRSARGGDDPVLRELAGRVDMLRELAKSGTAAGFYSRLDLFYIDLLRALAR